MTVRTYTSPQAFKQALEQRLRTASSTGADFARRRQLLVFDRFLARAIAAFGDAVLLKGGLVLEFRLERARATKDIDLRLVGSPDSVLASLQEAGRRDLGDFMAFEVGRDPEQPTIQNDGMQYEGCDFARSVAWLVSSTANTSALMSHLATLLSGSPRLSLRTTCSHLPESRRLNCACILSNPTSRRSSTPTRCRALARTRASKTFQTLPCLHPYGHWTGSDCARRSLQRSNFAQRMHYRQRCQTRPQAG